MSLIFKNVARSSARRVTLWLSFKHLLTRQCIVIHLFFAFTVSIRRISFPRFVGLLILSLWTKQTRKLNTNRHDHAHLYGANEPETSCTITTLHLNQVHSQSEMRTVMVPNQRPDPKNVCHYDWARSGPHEKSISGLGHFRLI
jgi:hypothetical protein